jgi:FKBP-type peptidyl-prolyl cis-trans isomerase (trigger factor)
VIGDGQAPAAIDAALIGMNVGDEKIVEVAMGAEDSDENKIRYQVRLTDLKERKLPELDDELAKDTGEYDTLDALKADIRKRIAEAKGRNEDRRLRTVMYDALREKNPMELPPSLVSRQAESLKTQLYRGVIEQMAKDDSDKSKEALQKLTENADKTAAEMVHQQLLMAEIARLSSITVDDDDIDAEIEKRAQETGLPAPMLRAEMNKAGRRDDLAVQILDTKIFDFVKTLVKIVEVDGEVKTAVSAGDTDEKAAAVSSTEEGADVAVSTDDEENVKKTNTVTKKVAAKKSDAEGDEAGTTSKKKTVAKKTTAKKVAAEGDEGAADKKTAKKPTAKKKPAEK